MPITAEHQGRSYPSSEPYEVTRAKIAEFAAALGDAHPAYTGDDAIAPPTFAAVLAASGWQQLFDDPELGLALRRTVHYDQKFAFERPLQVGDRITTTLRIDKVVVRGGSAFITVTAVLNDAEGVQVCSATSTLIHQEAA